MQARPCRPEQRALPHPAAQPVPTRAAAQRGARTGWARRGRGPGRARSSSTHSPGDSALATSCAVLRRARMRAPQGQIFAASILSACPEGWTARPVLQARQATHDHYCSHGMLAQLSTTSAARAPWATRPPRPRRASRRPCRGCRRRARCRRAAACCRAASRRRRPRAPAATRPPMRPQHRLPTPHAHCWSARGVFTPG